MMMIMCCLIIDIDHSLVTDSVSAASQVQPVSVRVEEFPISTRISGNDNGLH